MVRPLHATRILHSRRLSVSRMRENFTYGLTRGRWRRAAGLLDRDTRPKGEKRLAVAEPQAVPRHCSTLQLWNLLAKAPAHLREELAEDYRRMIYAEGREAVGRAGAAWFRAQVEAALSGGLSEFRGSRRSALHFHHLPARAMESAAYHQRAGADQRGVSPPHQDPGFVTERRSGAAANVRAFAQRPDQVAPRGRLVRVRLRFYNSGRCMKVGW